MICTFEELKKSIEMASQLKGDIWVLGDLNFPKLSSDNEHIPTIKPGCRFPKLYDDFITLLDDCNLEQMVSTPHRGENVLDLFLTSNHTLVKNKMNYQEFHIMTWSFRRSLPNQFETRIDVYETLCPQQMLVHKGGKIKNWGGECRDVTPTKSLSQNIRVDVNTSTEK